MSEGVVFHDADGHILFCNDSAERILGLTADQMAGRTSLDPRWAALREDGSPFPGEEHPAMVTLRTGEPCSDVIMGVAKPNGSLTWISINTRPATVAGAAGVVATFADVTARHALEARLREHDRLESLGRLAGGVAHDFNNLLTVIRGYGAMMRDQMRPTDPFREYAEAITEAAEHGAALTRELLAFSRTQRVCLEVFDIGDRVRHLEPLLRRLLREDIEVVLDLDARTLQVQMDPSLFDQVVINLSANASDAMPEGGRLLLSTQPAMAVPSGVGGPEDWVAVLTVSDTGTGMDHSTRQRLFEPFFTTKDAGHGLGLGLSTAHGIVAQAGGTIEVHSAVGCGCAMHVRLPLVPSDVRN